MLAHARQIFTKKVLIRSFAHLKCLMILMTLARGHRLKDTQNKLNYTTSYMTIAQKTNILPKGDLFTPLSALEIMKYCKAKSLTFET